MRITSCGVLVTDANGRLLVGQATGSPRWDIPKGVAEAGESLAEAAARELREETGLTVDPAALRPLGVHRYLPAKDLALFGWSVASIEPSALRCSSMVTLRDGRVVPELSRFAMLPLAEALGRVGKNLGRVLGEIGPASLPPPACGRG